MTEPESPSALLERAAARLAELADKATPGPWDHHDCHISDGGHTASVLARAEDVKRPLIAWLPTFSNEPWDHERNAWNNSAWIATLSPAAAPPLVEWLRQASLAYRLDGDSTQDEHALTFARLVLGEPENAP